MKKSLIFVGMLAVGYANAQYDGKVGVNTETPKATLEVQPSIANLTGTTNEGIIAPKLSKERIAAIATPVEGTLVYATDTTYTGSDVKVAKITEKGYYYYDGTEWVKSGVGANDQLWAQRDNNGITETYLKPADVDGNTFHYSSRGGIEFKGKSTDNTNTGNVYIDHAGVYLKRYNATGYGPALSLSSGRGTLDSPLPNQAGDYLGRIVWSPTLSSDKTISSGWASRISTLLTQVDSPTSYSADLILGGRALDKNTPNNTMTIVGKTDRVGIGTNLPEDRLDVRGVIRNRGLRVFGLGNVGPNMEIINEDKIGDTQAYKWNIYNMTDADIATPGGYKDALAFWSYNKSGASSVSNRPQMIITDDGKVAIGTSFIYIDAPAVDSKLTVDGDIRSIALKGTGNRPVFADANGRLIIGDATNAATSFKWVEDATNTSVKLAVTSAGVERTDNPVSITDTGLVKATSFQGSNGATIFPDYVFQKYYDGVSDIKADYTFKSLSQVEDFVKTNGHLPGYKSAAEIKNQGYIDLIETQLTNVEKIEELYLHSIEQEKTNKTQAQEIETLRKENEDLKARLEKLEKLLK